MSKLERYTCTSCGKEKRVGEYYQSQSSLYKHYGLLPVCKTCIEDIFNKYKEQHEDDREVMYNFCRKLDLPYTEGAYNGAIQNSEKTGWKIYQSYFKQINSFGDINNHGISFDGSDQLVNTKNIHGDCSSEESKDGELVLYDEDFQITPDIVLFWGKGFTKEEYIYLENFFIDFTNNYECDSPVQVLLFKNVAKTQLNADKALAQDNVNLYDKLMKTLSAILGDSNIKPVQETGANATDQATFGTLIKKWENDKPIPDPLPEWEEKNVFQYVKIWFLGHLSKMLNMNNPFSDEYEEEINKHKVDTPFEDEDESGE